MPSKVVFSHRANQRLAELYDYIADSGSPVAAINYIRRIRAFCSTLADFPERGNRRDEIGTGFRTITMERRVTVVYRLRRSQVLIVTVAYAGRDYVRELKRGK